MILASDFEKLPALPEFKRWLGFVKTFTSLNTGSFEQLEEMFLKYFPFVPGMLTYLHFEEVNEKPFYRVRLNIDEAKEDLNLIRTYSYPSVNFCNENGRANRAGKTVFYCSDNAFAAIYESKPQNGDVGFLSVWSNNINKPLKTGLYLPKKFENPNHWQSVANNAYLFSENYFEEYGHAKAEHFKVFNKFVAELFTTEKKPYSLTSYLAHVTLYGSNEHYGVEPKDLILYPSIASNSMHCNFAIHPNIVDRHLSLLKVIRFKVIEIDPPAKMVLSTGRIGDVTDNGILWRKGEEVELDFNNLP